MPSMYDLITLKELRQHDAYGMIRKHCIECDEKFETQMPIWNKQESSIYLCNNCHKELTK